MALLRILAIILLAIQSTAFIGYILNPTEAAKAGTACTEDSNCTNVDPLSYCNKDSSLCECRPGCFVGDNNTCQEVFGQPCLDDLDCQFYRGSAFDENAVCNRNTSVCGCNDISGRAPRDLTYNCKKLELSMTCIAGQICQLLDRFSQCINGRCVCSKADGWNPTRDPYPAPACSLNVNLGEFCNTEMGNNNCVTEQTSCSREGSLSTLSRCTCTSGYIDVIQNQNTRICARQLTRLNQECLPCINNGGKCYDTDNDNYKDGCLCPSTRSGNDCQRLHVLVSCTKEELQICYDPHPDIDLGSGGFVFAEGYGGDDRCQALQDPLGPCPPGQYGLTLPVPSSSNPEDTICGLRILDDSIGSYKYSVNMVAQEVRNEEETKSILFSAYCGYISNMDVNTGVGVGGWARDAEGEMKNPGITMDILNSLDQIIPSDDYLRIDEEAKLEIRLINSLDIYGAIKIKSCVASSEPVLPNPKANVLPLIENGCPAPGQNYINLDNNFGRVDGRATHLQTGPLTLFKLSDGRISSVYFHCQIDFCIEEGECFPGSCPSDGRKSSVNRLTRETGKLHGASAEVTIVRAMIIYDSRLDWRSRLSSREDLLISLMCVLVIVSVTSIALLIRRNKTKQKVRYKRLGDFQESSLLEDVSN